MASSEERMMILRMVEEGKITPEEGARLLSAMGEREAAAERVGATAGAATGAAADAAAGQAWAGAAYGDGPGNSGGSAYSGDFAGVNAPSSLSGRFLHVRVTNGMSGKQKVDVNIPLSLVDFGLRFVPQNSKMDVQAIRDAIAGGVRGRIVDVMDSEKGDHVEIFVE
jgi:hypothetical protein